MKKKVTVLIFYLFLNSFIYADSIPERPNNVPKKAVWEKSFGLLNVGGGLWKYYNQKSNYLYLWYPNGQLCIKGKVIYGLFDGLFEYWKPDGSKIMDIVYHSGKKIKITNYKIVFPSIQRPLNISEGAKWDFEENAWAYLDVDNNMFYMWYMNGERMLKMKVIDRRKEGKLIYWYKNGGIREISYYKNNLLNGKYTVWHENGELNVVAYYKNGELIWSNDYNKKPPENLPKGVVWHMQLKGWKYIKDNIQYVLYKNGKLKHKTEMNGLDYHGKTTSYYPTGEIVMKGQFINSSKEGTWYFYRRNGSIMEEIIYKNDKKIKEIKYPKRNKKVE